MLAYRIEINLQTEVSACMILKDCNLGMLCASVKRFSQACTALFALSADRSTHNLILEGKVPFS